VLVDTLCCSVLQCVVVCCSALQHIAVCCSVLVDTVCASQSSQHSSSDRKRVDPRGGSDIFV